MKYILLLLLLLPVSGFASDIDDERDRHNREQPLRNVDDTDPGICGFLAFDFASGQKILSQCCKPASTDCIPCSRDDIAQLRRMQKQTCDNMKKQKCPDYEDLCKNIR